MYHLKKLLYHNAHRVGHGGGGKHIPPPKPRWKSAGAGRDYAVNRVPALGSEGVARRLLKQTRP
jgi:hypothetical protein